MRSIRIEHDKLLYDERTVIPHPVETECLIKIRRAGICNTDLEIIKGYSGFQGIFGHEFVGTVQSMPPSRNNANVRLGDRVVGEITQTCGDCSMCQQGGVAKRNHCLNRTVLGIVNKFGTFADYIVLPLANLYTVPENITDRQAAFTEPLAAAFRIVEQFEFSPPGLEVAIIGDGKLGLLIAEVLSLQTCSRLILFGRHAEKMALVGSTEDTTLAEESDSPRSERCRTQVIPIVTHAETNWSQYENTFDMAIDACGSSEGLEIAGLITRPLGTIVMKTTIAKNSQRPVNLAKFVVKEQKLIGSRCGNFEMALDALSSGAINVDKYFSHEFSIAQYKQAFCTAATKGTKKVQFVFHDDSDSI